jgi:hypothetical protein
MEYRTVGEESEDEDDEVNEEAYEMGRVEDVGLMKEEQAGVAHLIHGWIQQKQPSKVSDWGDCYYFD